MNLTVCEAVIKRVNQLLDERKMSLYKLSSESGVLYNTLKSVMKNKNKALNLATVIQIADGFGMTVGEFLSSPIFDRDKFDL